MFWFQWKIKKNTKKIQVQQGSMSASSPVRSLFSGSVLGEFGNECQGFEIIRRFRVPGDEATHG
jgi:hypothetical protein